MSQTSYLQMVNEPGLAFRGHLNEILAALNTDFQGGTAPVATVAYMTWLDTSTTPATLRRRNSANAGWDIEDYNTNIRTVDSITALKALDKTKHTRAFVTGYYAAGDGGGGDYWYDPTDTTSSDNGGTIIVATDGGRWKLVVTGYTSIKQFGAKGDGITNDSSPAQSALNWANSVGGAKLFAPRGTYVLSTGLTIYANTGLFGENGKTIFQHGDGVTAITATGTVGTRLSGIILRDFAIKKSSGTTGHHLVMTLCDDCEIDNVVFDGTLGSNPCYAKLLGTRRANTKSCKYINGSSILWTSDNELTSGNWGENNTLTNCQMNAAKQGFNIIYQKSFTGVNSHAIGSTSTFGCGFVIEFENIGVVLSGCTANGHVRDGFYVEGNVAFGCKDIQFIGCIAYNNGEAGLNLDANYKDVRVIGGAYYGNTGTFGAGTGHGIMGAGSQYVTVDSATIRDNVADGIKYIDPAFLKVIGCGIHTNGGYGINLQGTKSNIRFKGNDLDSNTAGKVNGWDYLGNNEWDEGPFQAWTPVFYKSNESTTFTMTTLSAAFRLRNGVVDWQLYADTPSSALDNVTFFSLPIAGSWPDNSGIASNTRSRGFADMDTSGVQSVDGAFASDKLRISLTAAADTAIRGSGSYETV